MKNPLRASSESWFAVFGIVSFVLYVAIISWYENVIGPHERYAISIIADVSMHEWVLHMLVAILCVIGAYSYIDGRLYEKRKRKGVGFLGRLSYIAWIPFSMIAVLVLTIWLGHMILFN